MRTFGTILKSNPTVAKQALTFKVNPRFTEPHPPLPSTFDGRIVWKDYLSPVLDQGSCGCCYAFAGCAVLSDKYNIFTWNTDKLHLEFNPLRSAFCMIRTTDFETLVDKLKPENQEKSFKEQAKIACDGGSLYEIGYELLQSGCVETSCISIDDYTNYYKKHGYYPSCIDIEKPLGVTCADGKTAMKHWAAKSVYRFGKEFGDLEDQLKLEIWHYGPMLVGFNVFPDFLNEYDGKTIYIPKPNQESLGGHAVRLVGWGQEEQNGVTVKFWICINSWGKKWGSNGTFRIVRGNSDLQLEENNIGVTPDLGQDANDPTHESITPEDVFKVKEYIHVDAGNRYKPEEEVAIQDGKLIGDLGERNLICCNGGKNLWAYAVGGIDNLQKSIGITEMTGVHGEKLLWSDKGPFGFDTKPVYNTHLGGYSKKKKQHNYLWIIFFLVIIIIFVLLYRKLRKRYKGKKHRK